MSLVASLLAERDRDWMSPHIGVAHLPAGQIVELSTAVSGAFALDAAALVEKQLLAFVTADGLTYPRNEREAVSLRRNNTTILQRLERATRSFAELSGALASAQHPKVSLSAYMSDADSVKLGPHHDMWDNVVVQLSGSKTFHFEDADDIVLKPGDILSLPQGVTHDVTSHGASLHISIIFLRSSWLAEAGWDQASLSVHPEGRR